MGIPSNLAADRFIVFCANDTADNGRRQGTSDER